MPRYILLACASVAASFARADVPFRPWSFKTFPPRDVGTTVERSVHSTVLRTSAQVGASKLTTSHVATLRPRGGACDSDAVVFSKIAVGVILETAALLGVLVGGRALSSLPELAKIPQLGGLHVVQWLSFVIVTFASSLVGSFIDGGLSAASNQVLDPNVTPGDPSWYKSLNRPKWEPPGWVFPIMWLIVSKPTQIAALTRLFKQVDTDTAVLLRALVVYCTHLSLGDTWNKVFFGFQCPGKGAIVITTFFAVLVASAALFWTIDEEAGKLMLPTCAWVFVATALNWSIYLNN